MHRLLKQLLLSIWLIALFPSFSYAQSIGTTNENFARTWHIRELLHSSIDYAVETAIIGTFVNELGSDFYKNKLSDDDRLNAWIELRNISASATQSARTQLNQNGTNIEATFFSHGRCNWYPGSHEMSSEYREWASNVVKEIVSGHRLAKHLFAIGPLAGYQTQEMLETKPEDARMLDTQYGLGQQFPLARSLLISLPNKPALAKYVLIEGEDISTLKQLSLQNIAVAKAKRFMAPRCLDEGIHFSEIPLRSEILKSFWTGIEMTNALSKTRQLKDRMLMLQKAK